MLKPSYLKDHCESSRKHRQPLFACLEVDWFEFHFSSFNGIVITIPVIPFHIEMIEAVQVGKITTLVPPGPLVTCSTASRPEVIVSIFSGERRVSVIT